MIAVLSQTQALSFQAQRGFSSGDAGIHKTGHTESAIPAISEKDYHVVADSSLEEIVDRLAILEEVDSLEDLDINYSMGVLNIILGASYGTWVINKQTPNRQLWWSSPISGPRRYELHFHDDNITDLLDEEGEDLVKRWKSTKVVVGGDAAVNNDILQDLREELIQHLNIDILED